MKWGQITLSSLGSAKKTLAEAAYDVMLVYESAADGGLESFCRSIRAIYPEMVIVVGLTRMNHNRELQLLEIGVEDVVMESTPENIIVKRIIARLSASRPRQIARI